MHHATGNIINVTPLAVIDIVPGRGLGVLKNAAQQRGGLVILPHEAMAQQMAHSQGTQ